MGKLKNLLEKLTTEAMIDYPCKWSGELDDGRIRRYCDQFGFRLNYQGPEKGEFVFKNWGDGNPAFKVTYSNLITGRLRVKPTEYYIQYNEMLKQFLKKYEADEKFAPNDARISLVEGGQNAI